MENGLKMPVNIWNEHAEIIANTVYHTFPFDIQGFKSDAPHSDDCGGCLINAEVAKLVEKLDSLSHVEDVLAQLEHEKEERRKLTLDRWEAFEKAGAVDNGGSVSDLVRELVDERDRLLGLVQEVKSDMNFTLKRIENR
jgi:hypothetical protein